MAVAAIVVLPDPPAAITPSQRPSACSDEHGLAGAGGHRRDRCAAVAGGPQRGQVGAARGGHRGRRDRRQAGLGLVHAAVDDHDVDAAVTEPVAQVGALGALRVERPDQDDRCHRSTCPTPPSGPSTRSRSRSGTWSSGTGPRASKNVTPSGEYSSCSEAAADDDHVARHEGAGLALDRHLDGAVGDHHHLLAGLVAVQRHLLAGVVRDPAQQHLVAADRVQADARVDLVAVDAVPGAKRRRH